MDMDIWELHNMEATAPSQTQSQISLNHDKHGFEEKYEPFRHRNIVHPTSTTGAFFHMLKSCLGSGLLSMPIAFKHAGLIPGSIGTAIVAIVAGHCVHILVTTSREICTETKNASLNYTDTCEKVFKYGPKPLRKFSNHVRNFVDSAMAGVCLGGTAVYVVFIASSLKDICDPIAPDFQFGVQTYSAMLLVPLILITQFRYLNFLVPFSMGANLCLVGTFGITCFYTFTDLPVISEDILFKNVSGWPFFLSTAIFAMEGINVVMPVENEMAQPEHFLGCPGVLNGTMFFVALLYGVIGILGYWKFGDNVQGSITFNLPQNDPLALTAKILVVIATFFTYCLQMYAPMDIIWNRIKPRFSNRYHNVAQICLRTCSVIITVVLAVAVPDLKLIIGLVGAIFFSTLGLFIPAVVQTVHRWERNLGPCHYILWKNFILLSLYIIVLVSGCYVAINEILEKLF